MATDPVAQRAAALAAEHGLDGRQRDQIVTLAGLLATDPLAAVSRATRARAIDVHIADSLAALDVEGVPSSVAIADIGSGAGLPGLALAVALPSADVWLLESQARK